MMTTTQPQATPRFVRRTTLATNEYNKNFQMIDRDILEVISSTEADRITPLMSKIYLRLLQTPPSQRERTGVLRFEGETSEGKWIRAWGQLCKHLRVSSETANKALAWMHERGVIGYSAFKNGVGIRIFMNRAETSIGVRQPSNAKKILPPLPVSTDKFAVSESETPFNDPFGDKEILEQDLNPDAPESGATPTFSGGEFGEEAARLTIDEKKKILQDTGKEFVRPAGALGNPAAPFFQTSQPSGPEVSKIAAQLRSELEQSLTLAAARAATRAAQCEVAQTRKWFEERALPKAVRIAQKESYEVLRKHGLINKNLTPRHDVGRMIQPPPAAALTGTPRRTKTAEEIRELAEACVALLRLQGKAIEVTLSEMEGAGREGVERTDLLRIGELAQNILLEEGT